MYQAIKEKSAWKLVDDTDELLGFAYLIKLRVQEYAARAAWFKTKQALAVMLYTGRTKLKVQHVYVIPHSQNIPYSFIVEDYSIRLFLNVGEPLDINPFLTKCSRFLDEYLPDLREV